jgi:cell division protein FtsB
MTKRALLLVVFALVLTLSACSTGISQEDYDALEAEKAALETEKAELEGTIDTLTEENTDLQNELDWAIVSYPNQSVEAYGFTHGGYVGQVTIVVTDGELDVEINEAFMPHSLAEVTLSTETDPTDWDETNTLTIGSTSYALYIMYDGDMFKALQTDAGLLVYSQVDETGTLLTGRWDIKNLEMAIIRNDGSMKAYYDALNAGEFKLMTSLDDTSPTVLTDGLFKDGNPDYWQPFPGSLGWQANIDALEAFLEEHGAAFDTLAFTQVETTVNGVEDTYWQVVDSIAGATNSDFQDYFQLAQAAFGQLETVVD